MKSIETSPDAPSLITYPCEFPIKVMGLNADEFAQTIAKLIAEYDTTFDAKLMEKRLSKTGKYLGLTVIVHATSKEQLDNIYRALTSHPMVKTVL